MLLKKDEAPEIDYLEDWPTHYYEIETAAEKRAYLNKALEQKLEPERDKYRLRFLERRYFKQDKTGRVDTFMHAWIMMKAGAATDMSFFQKKRLQREWREYLKELCLLDFTPENEQESEVLREEWKDFARCFLAQCVGSKGYRSILFGVLTMKDEALAMKIAEEIQLVTGTFPQKLGLAEQMAPLRQIFVDVYVDTIADGEAYWAEVESTRRG